MRKALLINTSNLFVPRTNRLNVLITPPQTEIDVDDFPSQTEINLYEFMTFKDCFTVYKKELSINIYQKSFDIFYMIFFPDILSRKLTWTDFILLYIQWVKPKVSRIYITFSDIIIVPFGQMAEYNVLLDVENYSQTLDLGLMRQYSANPDQYDLRRMYQKSFSLMDNQMQMINNKSF